MSLHHPERVVDVQFQPVSTGPNWGRGFFRVWALLSVMWCGFVALLAQMIASSSIPADPVDLSGYWGLFVCPPLLLGAVMMFFGWVFRGFSR